MSSVAEGLREAAARLAETSDTARIDAELLMTHALGVSRSDMLLRHMRDPVPEGFAALVERRAGHEPVAHITGRQEFHGLDLLVTRDTLIPRGDSETLVETAFAAFAEQVPARICDLGTGTGALLLALLDRWQDTHGCAVDASEPALAVARHNAGRLGMAGRCLFVQADWAEPGWAADMGTFDLVVCNPPYVEDDADLAPDVRDFEPASALFAGPDGLHDYRILMPQLPELLAHGGIAVFEIGHTQADAVTEIAAQAGLSADLRRDLGGRPRVLILRQNGT